MLIKWVGIIRIGGGQVLDMGTTLSLIKYITFLTHSISIPQITAVVSVLIHNNLENNMLIIFLLLYITRLPDSQD